jgi:quinol monooxygenase YgiN
MPLTIVADIHAKAGQEQAAFTELKKLVAPTLKEAGCIQYDLHRDKDNPAHFLFYETWENRDLWQDHMASAHIAAHQETAKDTIETVAIYEMERAE